MPLLKISTIIIFVIILSASWFYEKRNNIVVRLESYNVQFSLADLLLKEYGGNCRSFEFKNYYAFQDHALTRYRILASQGTEFPYFLSESYLEVEEEFRESLRLRADKIKSCELHNKN